MNTRKFHPRYNKENSMKYLYGFVLFVACLIHITVYAVDSSPTEKSLPDAIIMLLKQCNLEARNALVHGDVEPVEKACMPLINQLYSVEENKKYVIDPIMNLAFSYTLAGQFEKAAPLYEKAKLIGAQLYEPDSRILRNINEVIRVQENMQKQRPVK